MDSETFDSTYLRKFNAQQREAVHAVDGPVLKAYKPGHRNVLLATLCDRPVFVGYKGI